MYSKFQNFLKNKSNNNNNLQHPPEVISYLQSIGFKEEFLDMIAVIELGAKKYGRDSWLEPGVLNHKDNHASLSRHIAEYYNGKEADEESGVDPLLHVAIRALFAYTVKKRGIS